MIKLRMNVLVKLMTLLLVVGVATTAWNAFVLYQDYQNRIESRKEKVQSLTETAHGIVVTYAKRVDAGELTKQEALKQIHDALTGMRYGDNDYLFMYDYDGVALVMPAKPELEGTLKMKALRDPNGVLILDELLKAARQGSGYVSYHYNKPGKTEPQPKISYVMGYQPWQVFVGTGVYTDDVWSEFISYATIFLIVIAGITVVVVGLAMWIITSITTPVHTLVNLAKELIGGKTDVVVPYQKRSDEVGEIAGTFELFRGSLVRIKETEEARKQAEVQAEQQRVEMLNRLSDAFRGSVMKVLVDLKARMEEMRSGLTTVNQQASTTAQVTANVATASQNSTRNVENVAAAAEELGASIQEINMQVIGANRANQEAKSTVDGSHDVYQKLNDAVNSIGEIATLISSIATQTNLLALNATIEAHRAGDAGRGFAVVANEVKQLSLQTAKATDDIKNKIQEVKNATESTMTASNDIERHMNRIGEYVTALAAAVEEQSVVTSDIARNINEAAQTVSVVSNDIVGVNQAAMQNQQAYADMDASTHVIIESMTNLEREVQNFLSELRK